MTGRYQAYPEYKASPIDWLEKIPSQWKTTRLKFLGNAIIGLTYSPDEVVEKESKDATLVLRSSNVQNGKISLLDNVYVNKDIPEKLRTKKDDILICSRNGSRALIGKNARIDDSSTNMTFGAFMTIFRSRYNEYLSHVFNSKLFEYQSGSFLTSTINQLTTGNLNSFEIPFPPEAELKPIINFLNHETAKIDKLISKQEKLIELLKEKRQAVISHAVTKGLNSAAKVKDSGVEWLGKVPETWNVMKFGITIKSAILGGNYTSSEAGDGVPLIKMGNLGRGKISLKKIEYLSKDEKIEKCFILRNGDFLFNTRNSMELVGKVSIWRDELNNAVYNSNILKIAFDDKFVSSSQYMSFLFNSDLGLSQLRLIAKGTTSVAAIYYKELKSLIFALPPLDEQIHIVNKLKEDIRKLDDLIQASEKAIALIKERKTALISAAVTGKIDVKNWQG